MEDRYVTTSSMEFVNDKYKKLMSVGFDHDKLNE